MKIEINSGKLAEALAMVSPLASKDGMLPALNAVAMHYRQDGTVAFVATDRYILGEYVIERKDFDPVDVEPGTWVIPMDTVTAIAKMAKATAKVNGTLPVIITTEGDLRIEARDYDTSVSGRLEAAEHVPNYQRLFPATGHDHGPAFFGLSAHTVTKLQKVMAASGKSTSTGHVVRFDFAADNLKGITFRVRNVPEFRGLVMPVKVGEWDTP